MDEDQDEAINRNAALGKAQRKREAFSIFSDEEESSSEDGDDVDEGDTDDDDDAEGAEDDDLEDDDEEEEDAEEDDDGAEGMDTEKPGTGEKWASGSDEEGENCPICLNIFRDQAIGTPESCMHYFCLDCILEWAKNANSCPVDRIKFKHICVRTHFGGTVLKKLPVQNPNKDNEEEQEDVTNCEVCGRSDREDSLLLCDGCDAGYHLDCLTPALHTVPVEEWFCPECAVNNPTAAVQEIDDEEVAFLVADAAQEPTTSRLRPTARRTRAIARTRQSERVRANVNRSRITRAHQIRDVPQYLMNPSLLDETIESVVAGLNTAVYHRPLTPRSQSTKKRRKTKGKKRKRAGTQKPRGKTSLSSGSTRKRRRKTRRKKGAKKVIKASVTTRSRIAKSLGLGKPVNGILVPSVYRPLEPSLKVMRTDIGAASLSVYGDPNDLDPFESAAEPMYEDTTSLGSPFSNKRRILSHSALRSHRPVARPISVKISSNGRLPAMGPEAQPEATPVPDVLESILAEQNVLLMDSSNIVINRDGSLKTKAASGQPPLLPSDRSQTWETTGGCSSSSASNSGNSTITPKGGWKSAGFTAPVKSAPAALPSTSDLPSTPQQQKASGNLRPAFSGTFTPMPEVSVGRGPGGSVSFPGTQWTGAPGKSAGDSQKGPSGFTPFRWLNSASNLHLKNNLGTLNRAPPKALPRLDISELPRIPKIKNQTGSNTQGDGIPRVRKLVDNDHNTPAAGLTEFEKSSKSPFQERLRSSLASGSANSSSIFPGKLRAPGVTPSSSSQSWRKVVGATHHPARLPKLDAYDPFEPTDDDVHHCGKQDHHSLLQPNVKKTDDIYDPFEPTGSDPSSSNSTPARNESRSEGEGESPASSPGNSISGGDKHTAEALSLYFDSDLAQLSYTQQTESCRTEPRETENPAASPDTYESFAAPSLNSDLESICDSGDKTEPRVMTLSAESSVDNEHTSQTFCSFSVSEDGPRSEQQAVNVDNASVLSSTCSDERTLKAVDKVVPTSTRNDVDISPETDLRSRVDKKVHTDSKVRSRSRSSSHSRRRSKSMVREKRRGYRSRSRSKEWKRLRSHSRDNWRSKSRSRSRSSSSERYRRRKVKQERFWEKRGRHSRSRSRERRSGSSSSEASTDSHKRRRRVSGSRDHKGSYKHSRSSTEKGKRRQYRRDQSREQYERRSRRSTSWSRERRHSRSRDKKKPWPKFRGKTRSWSRSSSRERRSRSRSSSRDKRRSRTRSSSREKRRSSRYREKRRSRTRSRSKERRKPRTRSRTRSRSRDQSRSRSRDRGLQSKWQATEVERRRNFTQEKVVSGEKDPEQMKMSPSTKLESSEGDASVPELTSSCHAESSQPAHDVPIDHSSSHSVDLKEESMVPNDAVQEEAKQIELPEQSKESSSQCENSGANYVDRFPAVDHGTLTSQVEAEIKGQSVPTEFFQVRSPSQVHAVAEEVSIPLIRLSKEEEIAPMVVNEEALPLEDQPLPQPFPAKTEAPLTGADTLDSVKPAISADDQKEAVGMSTMEKPQSPDPSGLEAGTCKSEQVGNGAARVCFQKEEPKQETVCLASSSIIKQEESQIDGNKSSEKNLGSVKTESSKECEEIPLLQSPEPAKIKTEPEAAAQSTGVKAKPLVKRVTWNLDSEKDEVPSGRPAKTSLSYRTHRYNKESTWKPPETSQPSNQVPMFQLPAPNYMIPPPIFPTLFPPQAFNQLNMPPPFMPPFPPLHPPPYAPVSQPAPPYVVQGNVPLIGSTPVPPLLPQPTYQAGTGASSVAVETHGPQVEGNLDTDNKACEDRTQSENYIKKLHVQERAVEEAKLALKPYYQNKEITKEEYKEILRKAVQKICHSKSGEINPVKVANLVKGYVEKYKHIRKYKKGAEGESSKESDTKAEEI